MKKKQVRAFFLDAVMITVGCFALAVGINNFLLPAKLNSGGVNGIGTILYYLLSLPLSVNNLLFNAVLFVCGFRLLGKHSVAKTVAGILLMSAFLQFATYIPSYQGDILVASVLGGLFMGIGIGLIIRREGSTGGSDFAALILRKLFPHISAGKFILGIDCVIIVVGGIAFQDIEITCYSLIALVIAIKLSDLICTSGTSAKAVYIISEKSAAISRMLMQEVDRGVTGLKSKGMYSGEDKMTLLCLVTPKQLPVILKRIKSMDDRAFIVVSDAREVFGEGFRSYQP